MAIIDRRGATVGAADPPAATTPNPDLAIKTACRAATTGNITLSGLQTIDGIAVAGGDRVLVWKQTDATQNGLYTASTGNWTRTIDAANNSQWADGVQVLVNLGALYGQTDFACTTADPITLGSSAISFAAVANASAGIGSYTVGDLFYASSATQLSRLAAVAIGAVLVSKGAGVAPAWSSSPTLAGRLSFTGAPVFDLSSNTYAVASIITFNSASQAVGAAKALGGYVVGQSNGSALSFTVGAGSNVAPFSSNVTNAAGSDANSVVYGAAFTSANAGPGVAKAVHAAAVGIGTSNGILISVNAQIQPVATQGYTAALFSSLTSSGINNIALGLGIESSGDQYQYGIGGGIVAPLPIGTAFIACRMGTASSAGAQFLRLLDNAGNNIFFVDKAGALQSGLAGTQAGSLAIAGASSGTISILSQAAAGTYNFNLPIAAGSAGQPLLSGGGGAAAQTYGTLGIAAGGTGGTTVAAARAGLAIDQRSTFSNAGYTVVSTDYLVAQTGILSAARTVTLPAASTFNAGRRLLVIDESGTATATNTISLAPNGTNKINGSNTTQVAINAAFGYIEIESDGVANWTSLRVSIGSPLEVAGILPTANGGTGLGSTTINQLLYSSASNVIAGLATANNGALVTSAGGVPSISSTLPNAVQDNITRLGTIALGAGTYAVDVNGQVRFRNVGALGAGFWLDSTTASARIFFGQDAGVDDFFRIFGVAASNNVLGLNTSTGNMTLANSILVGSAAYNTAAAAAIDVRGNLALHNAGVSLTNGLNSNIAPPTFTTGIAGQSTRASYIRISGPTGAFSVGGFTGGVDGYVICLFNAVAQTMTIVNEDASSTAANRITTLTGGNVVLRTTATSFATLIYDSTTSRWILVATN